MVLWKRGGSAETHGGQAASCSDTPVASLRVPRPRTPAGDHSALPRADAAVSRAARSGARKPFAPSGGVLHVAQSGSDPFRRDDFDEPRVNHVGVGGGRSARGRCVRVGQDKSVGPAGTLIEVLDRPVIPSRGGHTAGASGSVSAANARSGEALMTRTAVSVRLIAGAPVALVDDP